MHTRNHIIISLAFHFQLAERIYAKYTCERINTLHRILRSIQVLHKHKHTHTHHHSSQTVVKSISPAHSQHSLLWRIFFSRLITHKMPHTPHQHCNELFFDLQKLTTWMLLLRSLFNFNSGIVETSLMHFSHSAQRQRDYWHFSTISISVKVSMIIQNRNPLPQSFEHGRTDRKTVILHL